MPQLSDTEMQAWRGFLHTHDALWKTLDSALAREFGLSLPAYELLLTLEEAGEAGLRMTELARSLRFSGGGLTRLVDRLQQAGLLQRRRCQADGRGFEVLLTPGGRQLLKRVHARHLRAVRRHFLDRLTREEQASLAAIWQRLQGPTAEETR